MKPGPEFSWISKRKRERTKTAARPLPALTALPLQAAEAALVIQTMPPVLQQRRASGRHRRGLIHLTSETVDAVLPCLAPPTVHFVMEVLTTTAAREGARVIPGLLLLRSAMHLCMIPLMQAIFMILLNTITRTCISQTNMRTLTRHPDKALIPLSWLPILTTPRHIIHTSHLLLDLSIHILIPKQQVRLWNLTLLPIR